MQVQAAVRQAPQTRGAEDRSSAPLTFSRLAVVLLGGGERLTPDTLAGSE